MKRLTLIVMLLLACCRGQSQEAKVLQVPWNHVPWSNEEILIPPLRQKVQESNSQPDTADLIIEEAIKHLGKPYRYGAKGPKAFDCAGFARYVYLQFGIELPGGSRPQYTKGRKINNPKQLQRGDLVFRQGREANGHIGHTGIVVDVDTLSGRFRFIHAATSTGVIFSYSNEAYYARRYVGACRLIGNRTKAADPFPAKKSSGKRKR